ncbi:alanine--tRNA ligase [Zeaxanthinibacter enoshimensis]|uniref:Alanine--tRNA ligase n=1 Tax=Zeaxanthinibacter enoshimensis TaxID=392009 RepID=A0A4R6TP86_9FLAO|nr:alanine--tRNA ligase [Zeaxanthinibacter enoshimensis]TDQ33404.1 alanyl-tRNA synthetase [Zeaxanthinibacter enoshimensis]
MNSKDIRSTFLNFFRDKKHKIVPSAPMVIKDDPTLMFTNAGMNQFKEFFLGINTPADRRVTDTQKCLRVSGKHNDLEEVGKDTYHHTMFEMLGNWSFGDYFKKEAIEWAWELLTEVYKIDKDRLYISVFEGSDDDDKLTLDQEAFDLWKTIVPEDRILMGDKKDNFWEMGDQGPCGPCSEIHVDLRSDEERQKVSGASLVNQDHPLVVEIWNLVFIQYNRKADGRLEPLPEKHVDTGMGFERLCMVLQGKQSNYDTDVFTPLIAEISKITNKTYGKDEQVDIAIRVIADHIRAVSFAIADGQLPSNTGAGYVIRRILRRAIRYGFTYLDTQEAFMYKLVGKLTSQMGEAYPELKEQEQLVTNVVKEEEHAFLRTLEQGLQLLDNMIAGMKGKVMDGRKAFELYDTFGFPIDLTALILEEKGYSLDAEGFDEAMQEQKSRSKKASVVTKGDWTVLSDDKEQEFVGYDTLEADVKLVKYRKLSSKKEGDHYQMVFNLTPFYAEGGGQVGDQGVLTSAKGDKIRIADTRKENNEIVHIASELPADLQATYHASVDLQKRRLTARNHTATHLLHQALREVLGSHVEQKGSAVHAKGLRFDFSHFAKMTEEEIARVEAFVNERIEEQLPLKEQRAIPMEKALQEGAIALFGEKYGDAVRTVRFGDSMELCGGTHVQNTAEIWQFKITSEGGIAAGIRRIEAITSQAVKEYYRKTGEELQAVKEALKNAKDPVKAVVSLQDENSRLKKELEGLQKDKAKQLRSELLGELAEVNGTHFLARKVDLDAGAIKDLAFEMGQQYDDLFLLLASEQNGKAVLSCYISKPLVASKELNAGTIVRELGKYIQGGGGGQPFFATAGGKNPDGIAEALEAAKQYID